MVLKQEAYFLVGEAPTKVRSEEELLMIAHKWVNNNPKYIKYEHDQTLDMGNTLHGTLTTKRGARYWARFFYLRRYGSMKIVKSRRTTAYSSMNSIKGYINGQIRKGDVLDIIDPVDWLGEVEE